MDIAEVKQQLEDQKLELEERISAIKSDFKKGRSQDFAEQATENENHEVLQGLKAEAEFEISQIHSALKQIENSTYGQCQQCGESIQAERLKALPLVTQCISCAQ